MICLIRAVVIRIGTEDAKISHPWTFKHRTNRTNVLSCTGFVRSTTENKLCRMEMLICRSSTITFRLVSPIHDRYPFVSEIVHKPCNGLGQLIERLSGFFILLLGTSGFFGLAFILFRPGYVVHFTRPRTGHVYVTVVLLFHIIDESLRLVNTHFIIRKSNCNKSENVK